MLPNSLNSISRVCGAGVRGYSDEGLGLSKVATLDNQAEDQLGNQYKSIAEFTIYLS